jgi:hypothetical protein
MEPSEVSAQMVDAACKIHAGLGPGWRKTVCAVPPLGEGFSPRMARMARMGNPPFLIRVIREIRGGIASFAQPLRPPLALAQAATGTGAELWLGAHEGRPPRIVHGLPEGASPMAAVA